MKRLKRNLKRLFRVYLGLLAVSYLVWWIFPPENPVPAGMQVRDIPVFDEIEATDETLSLAYWEQVPAIEGAPTIVVLHGSPVASGALKPFLEELPNGPRVLTPDLPGFGASRGETALPSYSVRSHAAAVWAWLDELGVSHPHLVGYSMGGGVALEMERQRPGASASIALSSSIGVQEYELFGRYDLNHAVHAAQLGALAAVKWGFPHFGLFARQPLNLAYARNFFDTDQRPLRAVLRDYRGPLLIQHGDRDGLVPLVAAEEHARLAPQSLIRVYDGGHLLIIRHPEKLVPDLMHFIAEVDAGNGVTRAKADPERVTEAAKPFKRDRSWHYEGFAAFLIFLLLAVATFISEDLTCVSAGFLAANGLVSLPLAIGACFFGILVGDTMLYVAGRSLGRAALRRRPVRWFVSPGMERRAEAWFHRRGPIIILASRFLPGTRAGTYFTAGVLRAPFWQFFAYFGLASLLWTPLLVTLSSRLGNQMLRLYETYEMWALPFILGGIVLAYLAVHYLIPLTTWRGRRLLLGKWRRLTRWEYWPLWRFNTPVILASVWRAFTRYRHAPGVCAICNPAMPFSGLIGESKSQILRGLAGAGEALPPWILLPRGHTRGERLERLEAFQDSLPQPWPIVLKPDEGQRGSGVNVARSTADFDAVLEDLEEDWIVQAYVPGEEFGVFYVRHPDEERGRVTSITHKVMPFVVGDGEHTMEELILGHERSVSQGAFLLEAWADRLEEIPAEGQKVPIVELGTHARGCLFLDRCDANSPLLEAEIDRIAKAFDGFHFGRFDVRAPSIESLSQGQGIRVLELNGLTSESTHIYDPKHSVFYAWRTLIAQWATAMEIGEANRQRGVKVPTVRDFWRALREGQKRQHRQNRKRRGER
jgi:membrane protein DedA with SNARE-associated domain/pimeloyl-ACP methyl ester carboxylesterase